MYKQIENEFTHRFWGRFPLHTGASMFYLRKGNPIQKALYSMKYRNQAKAGLLFGRQFGALLKSAAHYRTVNYVIPLPLHAIREKERGYNQSLYFAQGIVDSLGAACLSSAVVRIVATKSQTHKNRMERFANVHDVFRVKKPALLEGKHILLVDDVMTTGATLESCGHALLEVPGIRISMATIALALNR